MMQLREGTVRHTNGMTAGPPKRGVALCGPHHRPQKNADEMCVLWG